VADLVVTIVPGTDLNTVSTQLVQAGLQLHETLEAIGTITGSADDADIPQLRRVPGVADVAKSVPVQIGPPGTPR
jgi:hypothetical protein